MAELTERLDELYNQYVVSKVGENVAKNASNFSRFLYFENACTAIHQLKDEYDLGIALATDGLWLGYIAERLGFPVLSVKMSRRLNGATWKPLDSVTESEIKDKKILVFDNDIVTGRTLKRACDELKRLNPQYTDLLLVYGHTEMELDSYEKWGKFLGEEGKDHIHIGNTPWGGIAIDSTCKVPKGFRKFMSVEKDFPDRDAGVVEMFLKSL